MNGMQQNKRLIALSISALVGILVIYLVYLAVLGISRSGKVELDIQVLPDDATVYIDEERVESGKNYVEPGMYTVRASRDGFEDDSVTVEALDEPVVAALLPTPVSDEAIEWANDPENALARESLGGLRANIRGETIRENNPLINVLPHVDVGGPFVIDYGYYGDEGTTETYIDIARSTPDGRKRALSWIEDKGYSVVDFDIRFSDYMSPLSEDNIVGDI